MPQSVYELCLLRREYVCSHLCEKRGSWGINHGRMCPRSSGRSTPRASSTCMRPRSKSMTIRNQCSRTRLIGMIQRRAVKAPSGTRHRAPLSFQRV
eukprot:3783288-Rhodomonas_salina.1